MSGLLVSLASLGAQLLQKSEGPVEETLCFSVVPLAMAVAWFAWRSWRWQPAPSGEID